MPESDWLAAPAADQSLKYSGNSILRGGQAPAGAAADNLVIS
jgi:hypothetical protein